MKAAVFIDRDGILNTVQVVRGQPVSPKSVAEFQPNLWTLPILQRLRNSGLLLIATTNQPGVSQGVMFRRDVEWMHEKLGLALKLDDVFLCPHEEADGCNCRKPKPGLLKEAAHKWQIDLGHSFVVSQKWQDAEAARHVGCTSLLLHSPWNGRSHHDFVMPDIAAAAGKILQLTASQQLAVA